MITTRHARSRHVSKDLLRCALTALFGVVWAATASGQQPGTLRLTERLVLAGDAIGFGRIGAVTADKSGSIYVADVHEQGQEILVFGETGRRTGTVGRSGEGPGEFRALAPTLAWRGDTLLTVHGYSGRRRLTLFFGQRVIRTEPLPAAPAGQLELDIRLFSGSRQVHALQLFHPIDRFDIATSEAFPPYSVAYYQLNFGQSATLLPNVRDTGSKTGVRAEMVPCWSPSKRAWAGVLTPFSDRGPLRALLPTGELVAAERDSFVINVLNVSSGRALRTIRRNVPRIRLSDAVWESLPSTQELRRRETAWRGQLRATGPRDAPCSVYRLRPEYQPVIRTVMTDEAGRIWVEVTSSRGHDIALIDEQGTWIGSGPMPDRDTRVPPFVRDNRLYIVTVDNLGVQSVKVYDIQRASGPGAGVR